MERGIGATATRGLSLAVCALLAHAATAAAATINVNTTNDGLATGGNVCSLREAINDVNGQGLPVGNCASADSVSNTIVLESGDYRLTLQGSNATTNASGALKISGNTGALVIVGAGANSTSIDATGLGDRVLAIASTSPAVTLQGLTVTGGAVPSSDSNTDLNGGGIDDRSVNHGLELDGVQVINNDAGTGPTGTFVGGEGGGIWTQGPLVIENSTISDNVAGSGFIVGGDGGGIWAGNPSVTIENSTISDNRAGNGATGSAGTAGGGSPGGAGGAGGLGGNGGGLYAGVGALTIANSTFSGNFAGAGGGGGTGGTGAPGGKGGAGGAGGSDGAFFTDTVTAVNDTFTDNAAGAGGAGGPGGRSTSINGGVGDGGGGGQGGDAGAISATTANLSTLTNVTISGSAVGSGGDGGAGTVSGSAGPPGAVADIVNGGGGSTLTLQNSITAASAGQTACQGVTDEGHNLSPDGCVPGSAGADPELAPLADNGGPTETMALLPGSPAIDAVPATGANCPLIDQRGVPRPQGGACDVGAFEAAVPALSTGGVTNLTQTSATLNGTVTAFESDATVQFEIGKTTAYGTKTPVQHFANFSPLPVTAALTGLSPGTTYHYRLMATNLDGTSFGADRTFTTPLAPKPPQSATSKPGKPALHDHINHRMRSAKFSFGATGATSFQCALVRSRRRHVKPHYSACHSPKTYKHLRKGRYQFFVRGTDLAGAGPAAVFRFSL